MTGVEHRGDGSLTAVDLSGASAVDAVLAAWDAGGAVVVLDRRAPGPDRDRVLDVVRPTHLVDGDGRRAVPGGEAVAPEVAAVVTTSGTTGEPKGVELTWAGLVASAGAVSRSLGVGDGDRWLCCLPLHGVGGLSVVARSWLTGVPVESVARFDRPSVKASRATLVSLVPTLLERALQSGSDLSRFRRILVGGAPVDDDLRRRAETAWPAGPGGAAAEEAVTGPAGPGGAAAEEAVTGPRVTPTYGLSETWGGVVHDGRPLEDVEVRLGEGDEILVRGPVVMRGYRRRPDLTAAVLDPDGWLRTGDIGAWSADGALRVVDRRDDLVISGGVNVSPTEVEAVLLHHPDVADVAVGGVADPEWGQRVVAYVVPADPARPPTAAQLRAFAAERLSAAKLPREVVLVGAVPRTAGGKLRRRFLNA